MMILEVGIHNFFSRTRYILLELSYHSPNYVCLALTFIGQYPGMSPVDIIFILSQISYTIIPDKNQSSLLDPLLKGIKGWKSLRGPSGTWRPHLLTNQISQHCYQKGINSNMSNQILR